MTDTIQSDAMISRLESELAERSQFIQGVIGGAQDSNRDLLASEKELLESAKGRVAELRSQLDVLADSRQVQLDARNRASQLQRDMAVGRHQIDRGAVEYRSAGAYLVDAYKAAMNDRDAKERMEIFTRAAAHDKTGDLTGIVPDPVVGEVINFIDAARPIVSTLGARPLPSATWHRPKVTAHTAVGPQGSNGAGTGTGSAADEKTELPSVKMTIGRLTANAVTYGGYVNVSRQSIDFGSGTLDVIVNDLAAQYAIQTEAAAGTALSGVATAPVAIASRSADDIARALWTGAGAAYEATKGQGRLILAVSPDVLGVFGPLFAPVNPESAQSTGFNAAQFGQGVMGAISGISLVMSAGLGTGEATLFSTAAIEAYETRVGTLQVAEPSVMGVQVGYAGYFTPLVVESGGIIPLTLPVGS